MGFAPKSRRSLALAPTQGGPLQGDPPWAVAHAKGIPPLTDDLTGCVLDRRYLLQKKLASGAMGSVYRAQQLTVERTVAVKVMHSRLANDPALVQRFDREAEVEAQLQHPNCIEVLDAGTAPSGARYLVMPLLEGHELRDEMTLPMTVERTVDVILQVLDGLGYAHRHGFVHRDVKPENVFIVDDEDGQEVAKLVDFGLASLDDTSPRLTEAGKIFGTPWYMSPEQAAGRPVDGRCDLYAVGVMMFEMLSGAPPFDAESMAIVLNKHFAADPPPLPNHVPGPGARVIYRLLAKSPEDRYQTAEETADALVAALTQPELRIAPSWSGPIAVDPTPSVLSSSRRSGRLFALAAVAAAAVVGLFTAPLWASDGPVESASAALASVPPHAILDKDHAVADAPTDTAAPDPVVEVVAVQPAPAPAVAPKPTPKPAPESQAPPPHHEQAQAEGQAPPPHAAAPEDQAPQAEEATTLAQQAPRDARPARHLTETPQPALILGGERGAGLFFGRRIDRDEPRLAARRCESATEALAVATLVDRVHVVPLPHDALPRYVDEQIAPVSQLDVREMRVARDEVGFHLLRVLGSNRARRCDRRRHELYTDRALSRLRVEVLLRIRIRGEMHPPRTVDVAGEHDDVRDLPLLPRREQPPPRRVVAVPHIGAPRSTVTASKLRHHHLLPDQPPSRPGGHRGLELAEQPRLLLLPEEAALRIRQHFGIRRPLVRLLRSRVQARVEHCEVHQIAEAKTIDGSECVARLRSRGLASTRSRRGSTLSCARASRPRPRSGSAPPIPKHRSHSRGRPTPR